jgi:Ca2+-binding EF-hand superfamily protein
MVEDMNMLRDLLSVIDLDGDGTISYTELKETAREIPLLLQAFESLLPHSTMLKGHLQSLNSSRTELSMDW